MHDLGGRGLRPALRWADEGPPVHLVEECPHRYTPWNCIAGFFCRAGSGPSGSARPGTGWRSGSARRSRGWSKRCASSSVGYDARLRRLGLAAVRAARDRAPLLPVLRRTGPAPAAGRPRLRPDAGEPVVRPHVRLQRPPRRRPRRKPDRADRRGPGQGRERRPGERNHRPGRNAGRLPAQGRRHVPGHQAPGHPRRPLRDRPVRPGDRVSADHERRVIQNYVDDGATDPDRIMRCFTPEQLPVLTTLAREFAICDQWFSSLPGPTWPNRFSCWPPARAGSTAARASSTSTPRRRSRATGSRTATSFRPPRPVLHRVEDLRGRRLPGQLRAERHEPGRAPGPLRGLRELCAGAAAVELRPPVRLHQLKYGAAEFDVTGPGDFTCGNSMHPLTT